jgi:predicted DNA-binding protein YlxM (UPF0122 family)
VIDVDELEERVRFGELFDAYSEVLTEKQREVCDLLLGGDLTIAELGHELGLSRQGAHDLVKRSRDRLEEIERALGLLSLRKSHESLLSLIACNERALPDEFMKRASNFMERRDPDV